MEADITIPTSDPTYHLVLSQKANPYLDGTPRFNYPSLPRPGTIGGPNY